jgi:hypothetical protein
MKRALLLATAVACVGVAVLLVGGNARPLAAQQLNATAPAPAPSHLDVAFAFRFGTLGFGLEAGKAFTDHLSARVGANFFKVSRDQTQSNISYTASLKLHALSALLDLYPGARGSFHFTAGLMTNPLTISATGQPSGGSYTINNSSYTSSQVGTLTAEGKYPGVSPYLGLGFGTPARTGSALTFLFDLGVVIGKPTISLSASGSACAPGTTCGNDLQAQRDKTQTDIEKYLKVYPVLSFGLAYHLR